MARAAPNQYEFVIGDDWRAAVGVAFALAVTALGGRAAGTPSWWVRPVAVAVLLPLSLWRAARRHGA